MHISEFQIEEVIYTAIKENKVPLLRQRGLLISEESSYYRQVNLKGYGRMDLLGVEFSAYFGERTITFEVIEIKKGEVNYDTLKQALRYCKGIEKLICQKFVGFNYGFKITLIGNQVNDSEFRFFPDFFKQLNIYSVNIDLEVGITFKNEFGFYLSNVDDTPLNFDFKEIYRELYKNYQVRKERLPF